MKAGYFMGATAWILVFFCVAVSFMHTHATICIYGYHVITIAMVMHRECSVCRLQNKKINDS